MSGRLKNFFLQVLGWTTISKCSILDEYQSDVSWLEELIAEHELTLEEQLVHEEQLEHEEQLGLEEQLRLEEQLGLEEQQWLEEQLEHEDQLAHEEQLEHEEQLKAEEQLEDVTQLSAEEQLDEEWLNSLYETTAEDDERKKVTDFSLYSLNIQQKIKNYPHCNEDPIYVFLFWEYLFPIFGIGSLQCREKKHDAIKDQKCRHSKIYFSFCMLPFPFITFNIL